MGTNYYAVKKEPCLGREMHLGKSSAGWKFLFKEHEEIRTFSQFVFWLENNVDTGDYVLFDEYSKEITKTELLELIENKQKFKVGMRALTSSGIIDVTQEYWEKQQFEYSKNIDGYRFSESDFS